VFSSACHCVALASLPFSVFSSCCVSFLATHRRLLFAVTVLNVLFLSSNYYGISSSECHPSDPIQFCAACLVL
jgi:hypothetical protein